MKLSGANMGSVKRQNRTAILNYINEHGPVSRKDVAAATGLTPAAVTVICNDFLERGLLVEAGEPEEAPGAGRRKIPLAVAPDYCYILAVTVEPEETVTALSDLRGGLVERRRRRTDREVPPEAFLAELAGTCRALLEAHPGEAARTAGASVAISGPVDADRGVSLRAYGIWDREVPVRELLETELGLPVILENNVNAFARAELSYGVGRRYDNLLVIKWGPGVGGAITVDRDVYQGRHGKSAEIGHFIVEKDGPLCSCGRRGCLETMVSWQALQRFDAFAPEEFGATYLRAREQGRSGGYDEAIDLFARAVVNSITVLAPNRVVLCGKLFGSEAVRERMIQSCLRYDSHLNPNRILYTDLSDREDYIGAVAAFVQTRVF